MKHHLAFFAAAAVVLLSPAAQAASNVRLGHLRCEFLVNPLGVDAEHPRLSWQLQSPTRGQKQTAYQVLVASSAAALKSGKGDLWNSGKVASDDALTIPYSGRPLASGQQCWWKVRVWDKDGAVTESPAASWRMGLLKPSDWKAQWISAQTPRDVKADGKMLAPSSYLRRTFTLGKTIKQATIFATAHGVYELHLNGAKVGNAVLAPGWTDYNKRVEYQVYDVTSALKSGANTIGAVLGDGWYSGFIGFGGRRDYYGVRPEMRLQMEIVFTDGTRQTIVTDGTWKGSQGPITYSDMLQGESYDARKELTGWDLPSAKGAGWNSVVLDASKKSANQVDVTAKVVSMVTDNKVSVVSGNDLGGDPAYNTVKHLRVDYTLDGAAHSQTVNEKDTIQIPGPGEAPGKLVIRKAVYGVIDQPGVNAMMVAQHGPAIRVTEHIKPIGMTEPKPGTYIVDLGQNMVGWARLKVQAKAGTRIQLRFAEMLSPDGEVYTTNLRSANCTDTYICKGGGVEVWEPHFTFHGFRYVEVTGFPGKPGLDALTGCVVGSDTPKTGTFECSSELVNKLQHNIDWGQRGNFVSVPTDCPQRDERLGWMGDAQIFVRTATYNRDTAGFYEKWMQDVEDAQSSQGAFSDVSPRKVDDNDGAPAWGDAGVIVPWTVYQAYGDTTIIEKHWAAMNGWMNYITSVNPDGLWMQRRNNDFGDWLSINADTPKDVLATAYYGYDASLMAKMARVLGRTDEAAKYDALFERIKSAFNKAFVSADGKIKGDTQTAYVLALRFNLLPDNLRAMAATHLTADIAAKNSHLSTGFVGVGYLCPTLTATGNNDVAYKLLQNDTFPSWGFSIRHGATTIWERWDGWTPEKGFQDPGMNSFNHYSLGSVGQWLYQDVAGIDTDPNQPGYKHILLHPHPGPGLTHAAATFDSVHGPIASGWKIQNGKFVWNVSVPANTTATAWIPSPSASGITEGGKAINTASGVKFVREESGAAVYELQSGTYTFSAPAL
ncbi:MAG: family 78 glycoside hydrolase catalytic domain [Capsulimonas sp.]|uniref:family 78 glycoside hydrolase catalytic domain n=1 Tax=Capsulimonas sp. TaxID=2494211 RepID=UPI003264B056